MNARKLPSGKWQSKVYIGTFDGKQKFVSVTAGSKRECLLRAAEVRANSLVSAVQNDMTVNEAVNQYIKSKRGVLSPATIAGYLNKQKTHITPHKIAACELRSLTPQKVQSWVSDISQNIAPKTVKNTYGLLTASVKMFFPKADLTATLPQAQRYGGYVPSTEEVVQVIEAAKKYDERMYRACLLAAFATLRRGEICALMASDINGNILHVSKDMVRNEKNEWIIKPPKTSDSVRDVPLPSWIIKEMPISGPLVNYTPEQITNYFIRIVRKEKLPHFRFHDLRKFSVSLMATQGVSMSSIKEIGGWSNLQTPAQIYIKTLADAHQREMRQYLEHLESESFEKLRQNFVKN